MNLEKYVLGSEIAEQGDFDIANVSMLINQDDMVIGEDYLKFGGITLLNIDSPNLPEYFRKIILRGKLTKLENLYPTSYIKDEVTELLDDVEIVLNKDGIEDVQKENSKCYYNKISKFVEPIKVSGKNFLRILDNNLLQAFTDKKNRYILDISEFPEADEYIEGKMNLTKDKVLVWY